MANSTYLSLTNTLLEDFNEPVLTSGEFSLVRSVHRVAKNAINRSIDYIQTKEYTWPFMKADGSQVLTIGQTFYNWPSDMKHVDMESFYIEKDDSLSVNTTRLKEITEQEWRNRYRSRDYNADSSVGIGVPDYVFRRNDDYGVTGSPDAAYTTKFTYWTTWTRMTEHDDESSIPSDWDHVIIANAYPFMYKFYNDSAGYDRSLQDARDMLKDMRQLLIPKDPKCWVGQLNVGGQYAQ
jgi:hypothetical protein